MKRIALIAIFTITLQQLTFAQAKNIKTWKGAIALLGISDKKAFDKLEAQDFKEDDSFEKDDMEVFTYVDSEERHFIHPAEGRKQSEYYEVVIRNERVVVVHFTIAPFTESEMDATHAAYMAFERDVKAAGYKAAPIKKTNGSETRAFHNPETGFRVIAFTWTKANKVGGAEIFVYEENLDLQLPD